MLQSRNRFCTIGLSFLFLLVPSAHIPAQPPTAMSSPSSTPAVFSLQTLSELKQLQHAALDSDHAYRQVAHLANNIGPRLSGSAQAAKAVEYVAAELKALDCNVQLEKVMVPHWVRGEETAALVQFPGQAANTTQKIVLCALGDSIATPADGIEAEVIAVRNFDELKSVPREKVAGKIVLFNYPFDKQMAAEGRGGEAYGEAVVYRSDGPSAAARQGAVACLVRSVEDADLIVDLARQGPVKIKLVLTPQTLPDVESANVIGEIKGSEHPEQIVIVSGHLDSWDLGTGAIDDGAGVALSMEAANLIRKLNLRPKRTIRVVAWMNEENGLAGSKQYAKDHEKEWTNHFAAMETDGGAGHPIGLNIKGKTEIKKILGPVAAILQKSGAGMLNFVEHCGADIESLEKADVPAFSPIQDSRFYFNYHHTAADTLDKIVPKELGENSAVVAVVAYALANLEQPLPR